MTIDDFDNILKEIKDLINTRDLEYEDKKSKLISLIELIIYPECFSSYQGLNFYKDKDKYISNKC